MVHKETTHPSPWSDQEEVRDPEYPEQPDDPGKHPGNSSQTGGNTGNELDASQLQHDDSEVTNNTWYHDTQDIDTGSPHRTLTQTNPQTWNREVSQRPNRRLRP